MTVTLPGGGAATLYTDATKDTPLGSNVVTTDALGNLVFFADPGTYTCTVNGSAFSAVLAVNPLEPSGGGGGSGTVTSVAVESANGLAGTVADSATTPQITLSTTVTGLLKGVSGVIEAATAGTDYLTPSGSGASLTGITATQVGADASGAAATAQSNAEAFATSAVGTETSRAEAAEALLAPLASPALTGTPTAPTKSALTDSTAIATTAYADAAVAVEASRAEAAESANASAIAAETSRAESAEALKAPLVSPTFTGTPAAPTATALTDSTQVATTAYADSAVGVETTRAEAAEGLKLAKAGNLSDLASGPAAVANLGLSQIPYLPADDGLLAASWDPVSNSSTGTPSNNHVFLIRIPIRVALTATYIVVGMTASAASSASTGTYAGLYQVSGTSLTLLSGSSDMGTTFASAVSGVERGLQLALTAAQSLTAGAVCYAALLFNMSSAPTLVLGGGATRGTYNQAPGQAWPRICDYTSGTQTALPASGTITSSNIEVANYAMNLWAGLK